MGGKYKRLIWIAFAVVFVGVLFFLKNKTTFKNTLTDAIGTQEDGLTYGTDTLENLVSKDTDGDGILDWEEGLWGTDPTKKETTPGTPDRVAIEKLKSQTKSDQGESAKNKDANQTENLTQTEKFSRELFATTSSLNQNGAMDQTTADQIGNALAEKIQNSVPRKIFTLADVKAINDDSVQAIKKYSDTLDKIYGKYPETKGVLTILQELVADETNVAVLSELDPIIKQTNEIMGELVKMSVPQSLSFLHLDLLNSSEVLSENMADMKFFISDPIVAISAISQYENNSATMETSASALLQAISGKLGN